MNIMIDIETLGTKPGDAIISIGAAKRVDGKIQTLHLFPSVQGNIDINTVFWWFQQPEPSRLEQATQVRTDLAHCLIELQGFLNPDAEIWAKGSMDCIMLEYWYNHFNYITPWEYNKVRDLRTIMKTLGYEKPKEPSHSAVDDAVTQLLLLETILESIADNRHATDVHGGS